MAETLVNNYQQMDNKIHQLLFTSSAILMWRSETFQTILVLLALTAFQIVWVILVIFSNNHMLNVI